MIINYTDRELDMLARIMRAEALNEGDLGMMMVGNVVINRAVADCLTFKNITTISEAIYQPNQFVGTNSSLFNASATNTEKQLAKRVLNGEFYHPATHALWFKAEKDTCPCMGASYWYFRCTEIFWLL